MILRRTARGKHMTARGQRQRAQQEGRSGVVEGLGRLCLRVKAVMENKT